MNVLVTGASSGIGEHIAESLASTGHHVVLQARRKDRLEALAERCDGPAIVSAGDVGIWEDCVSAVEAGVSAFGHLDALVHAAGYWVDGLLSEIPPNELERFIRTDVQGALQMTRAIVPHLESRNQSRVIHINGLQAYIRQRPPVIYTAVESATRGMCESLRWEAASHVTLLTLGLTANAEIPQPSRDKLWVENRRDRLSRKEVADAVRYILDQPSGVCIDELVLTPLGQQWKWD